MRPHRPAMMKANCDRWQTKSLAKTNALIAASASRRNPYVSRYGHIPTLNGSRQTILSMWDFLNTAQI